MENGSEKVFPIFVFGYAYEKIVFFGIVVKNILVNQMKVCKVKNAILFKISFS